MKGNAIEYCGVTKKYCYSSEAKANRAVNKYDDIKRAYFCHDCCKWHTTSREVSTEDECEKITEGDVASRLKALKRKQRRKINRKLNKPK